MLPIDLKTWALVAGLTVAFACGWTANGWRWEAKQAAAVAEEQAARDALERMARKNAQELEKRLSDMDAQARKLTRRIADETRADAYRCRVPESGVRLLREAAAPGQPDGGSPRP